MCAPNRTNNYAIVTYSLEEQESGVKFAWHQQGFASEEGKCHTEDGMKPMLAQIKALAESL